MDVIWILKGKKCEVQRLVGGSHRCEIHLHYPGCYCFVPVFLSYFWYLRQVCLVFMCQHTVTDVAGFSLENKTMNPGDFQVTQEGRQWKQNPKNPAFLSFPAVQVQQCSLLPGCDILGQSLNISLDGQTRQTRKKKCHLLRSLWTGKTWTTSQHSSSTAARPSSLRSRLFLYPIQALAYATSTIFPLCCPSSFHESPTTTPTSPRSGTF